MRGNYSVKCLLLVAAFALNGWGQDAEGVKYRGIFVNDEDWSLRPWAVKHFGKKEQIGTNAYAEIFALMKKNGLNLIWPAMHEGGYEFSSRLENFDLADKYGITVGTSHCEPMLRNNCYLPKRDHQLWSWTKHRDFIEGYWREGVKRGEGHNVMYTIGMRGIHDGRMREGKTNAEKRKILEEVFAAQCAMLPKDAPKLFVPYKEVLPIFNSGLNVPQDAIIMWVNDNFGYIRRLGNPQTFKPSNSQTPPQGIYWHLSYHGHPHGYIHLCTTPPAFLWYELVAKCWENGVRDVWMVNAGDVFQAEILLDAYGRFAANPEAWKVKADPQREAIESWVSEEFFSHKERKEHKVGECLCELCGLCGRISAHLAEYYNLGFNRRPEHMCIQWTTNLPASVKSSLLKRYHALLEEDDAIECEIRKLFTNDNCHNCSQITNTNSTRSTCSLSAVSSTVALAKAEASAKADTRLKIKDDYFRLIGFQVRFLAYAGIIHLEGRDKAYARSVIDPLYERWDGLDGGKWAGFWCDTIDEHGGMRQPTTHNRWSSQMQWPWNEPDDPAKKDRHGRSRNDYAATAYRADVAEPMWLEPTKRERGMGNGEWKVVPGLGTRGNALALLPVKSGVCEGATLEYDLSPIPRSPFPVPRSLVLQFLPDFALWPGLKLGLDVVFDGCEPKFVEVPCSNSNLGEHDRIRNQAVQDNFIRVEIPVPAGVTSFKIVAKYPGVVIDRIGIRR